MADDTARNPAPDPGALPEDWDAGDPEALVQGHAAGRRAELESLDPAIAAFYERAARGLAGAGDPAALKQRQVVLLGRERGIVTHALEALPGLPVERRRVRGRALNLVKRWLTEIE